MLLRKERSAAAADPEDRHYFAGGIQHGEITNNGNNDPDRVDWNQSILTKTCVIPGITGNYGDRCVIPELR